LHHAKAPRRNVSTPRRLRLIHVDWMIGSAQIDVDGVDAQGETEPLMRSGEWVT